MAQPLERVIATLDRLRYYAAGVARRVVPAPLFNRLREEIMVCLDRHPAAEALMARVNYCNGLSPGGYLPPQTRLSRVERTRSRYFLDLDEYLRFFPQTLHVDYVFGDVTTVPETPSIVKSRPIGTGNQNAVLLNLDKLRHFRTYRDNRTWRDKVAKAAWRGSLNNPLRGELVRRHGKSSFADIGHVGGHVSGLDEGLVPKSFLSPRDQLGYRYIISVEGFDVATNLKWVMASGSVCLMPQSRYETWFMEGALEPGHHFVALRDDFADLEEKIDLLESRPDLAADIVRNANAYVAGFYHLETERLVSLLVLQKYFEATEQMPPSPFTSRFFG